MPHACRRFSTDLRAAQADRPIALSSQLPLHRPSSCGRYTSNTRGRSDTMSTLDSIRRLFARIDDSNLLTVLSSVITLTPSPSIFFTLLTLPALLHRDVNTSSKSNILKKVLAMALGATTGSLVTTHALLPSPVESISMQALVSAITSLYIGAILGVHRVAVKVLSDEDQWLVSPLFGLIWANLSPFGRYVSAFFDEALIHQGIPTPGNLEMFRRILPYIGPTDLDFLVGTYGHAIGEAYDQLHVVDH